MGRVLGRQALKRELAGLKKKDKEKKIVFTNGCFDIIHPGHVRYLEKAKSMGDVLVVGVNSDRSVSRMKPGRPVNGQKARAEVLAALRVVDYVCVFGEETPHELIRSIKPDVLVKGGDWKRKDIVGADLVPLTRSLPFQKGYSTSRVIEKIEWLRERQPERTCRGPAKKVS